MKKLLYILIFFPSFILAQQTYVPDDAFEGFLEANGMGNGISNDDYVTTSKIDTVTILNIMYFLYPSDLTGIEDFTLLEQLDCSQLQLTNLDISQNSALTYLNCSYNQLTFLDLSNNTALTELYCSSNQITSLDVSANTALTKLHCNGNFPYGNPTSNLNVNSNIALTELDCSENGLTTLDLSQNASLIYLNCSENNLTTLNLSQNTSLTYLNCARNWVLTGLDVSANTALEYLDCHDNLVNIVELSNHLSLVYLYCQDNKIISLDLSQNSNLIELSCGDNQLTSLNIRNGNNNNLTYFSCDDNFSLNCINVDDVAWATTNLTDIDPQHYFSTNCPTTLIQEHTANKELLKVTDLLGRETKQTNQPLFYIYDDGTVEKRIVIE